MVGRHRAPLDSILLTLGLVILVLLVIVCALYVWLGVELTPW